MKTVYKFLGSGALAITFALSAPTVSFAQENPEKEKLYNDFVACRKETDKVKRDACYAIAKQYLDKFGTIDDEYTQYVTKQYKAYETARNEQELFARFNGAIKSVETVNPDEAFASGKVIYAQKPELIDVPIVLASIGFDNASAKTPNDKYNADTINLAKTVIQQLETGKTSKNKYGANAWSYETAAYPDGKNNTLGWMNYTIGYIMYNRQGMKKEALPFLYKATQINSGTKNNPQIYQTIGNYYVDEFVKLDKERTDKIAAAGNVDTDETKNLLALQKGYADRAIEAYARAHKVTDNDPKNKAYKDGLLTRLKELYGIRYDNKMEGFDAYVVAVANKPFTDPMTAVVPVAEPVPATTTTSTTTPAGATSMTTTPTTAPASTTRPATGAATTTVKPTTAPTATTVKPTTTTKKPVAKAPVKKKGTR